MKIGELLFEAGWVSPEVSKALRIQKNIDRMQNNIDALRVSDENK